MSASGDARYAGRLRAWPIGIRNSPHPPRGVRADTYIEAAILRRLYLICIHVRAFDVFVLCARRSCLLEPMAALCKRPGLGFVIGLMYYK